MKTEKIIEFLHDPSHFIRIASIEKYDDGSGFTALLSVQSGALACMGHPFYFDDLKGFAKDMAKLSKTLTGFAKLGPEYEPEFIRFEATTLGHMTVSGEIREFTSSGQLLKFSFSTDQSYLPAFLKSIEEVLETTK